MLSHRKTNRGRSMAGWKIDFHDGVVMEADHLHRDRSGELMGQLTVWCDWKEAVTFEIGRNGTGRALLSRGDFNFSGLRSRQERASHLEKRARANGKLDWYSRVERFCFEALEAETKGVPPVSIWDLAEPSQEIDDFAIDGVHLPRHLPAILFGDGGGLKSYFALYLAGRLGIEGVRVGYFDWELGGEDHKRRYSHLFGHHQPRPDLIYCRCEMPISYECDRILQAIRDYKIQYAIFDSISFAADQRAEEHETCLRYFRAARQFAIGGLHVAHINKSESGDQKPFGSVFWFNGARAIWFSKADHVGPGLVSLTLYHRKANCGPLRPATGFLVRFTDQATTFERMTSDQELPSNAVAVWERVAAILANKGQPMTFVELAGALDVPIKSVHRAIERKPNTFRIIRGGTGVVDRVDLDPTTRSGD